LIPVIAEFYALARKRAGRDTAEKYFSEIEHSGLDIVSLNIAIAKRAGILRAKYQERISSGDCLIAAVGIEGRADYILTLSRLKAGSFLAHSFVNLDVKQIVLFDRDFDKIPYIERVKPREAIERGAPR
jgi:predicted nucleic acid-binding protein